MAACRAGNVLLGASIGLAHTTLGVPFYGYTADRALSAKYKDIVATDDRQSLENDCSEFADRLAHIRIEDTDAVPGGFVLGDELDVPWGLLIGIVGFASVEDHLQSDVEVGLVDRPR